MITYRNVFNNNKYERIIKPYLHKNRKESGNIFFTLAEQKFKVMNNNFSVREQIIEVANKLFVYTDNRQWQKLLNEVFTGTVLFDMSSAGAGEPVTISANELCDKWEKGFEGIDVIHHQAGNYLVTLNATGAAVHAYAIASHFKKTAQHGNTREFVGSYDLLVSDVPGKGWRINTFKYNLKYIDGNIDLL